jgi:hypothetical protein
MTDFRKLCAELLDWLEVAPAELVDRARTALAEGDGVGPTLEQVNDLCEEHEFGVEGYESVECLQGLINDAIARYGTTHPRPVPVAERLPEPEDCLGRPFEETDAGYCWWWFPEREEWCFADAVIWRAGSYRNWTPTSATHWLPHHALPVPQQEAE